MRTPQTQTPALEETDTVPSTGVAPVRTSLAQALDLIINFLVSLRPVYQKVRESCQREIQCMRPDEMLPIEAAVTSSYLSSTYNIPSASIAASTEVAATARIVTTPITPIRFQVILFRKSISGSAKLGSGVVGEAKGSTHCCGASSFAERRNNGRGDGPLPSYCAPVG